MNQYVLKFLQSYSYEVYDVNRLLVSAFISINNIEVINNEFIREYIITETDIVEFEQLLKFIQKIKKGNNEFGIEELIQLFEFVISPEDKEVNGAVYTPETIREYIISKVLSGFTDEEISNMRFADISCGCGGFFYTLAIAINKNTNKPFSEIYRDNIFGVDIEEYSITRTKLLLSLLAISYGEDTLELEFNLYTGNSLEFDWSTNETIRNNGGFDAIIGNPPYVSSSKIDEKSKIILENWSVSKTGKTDLYIPFFQIGIENLRVGGILGYITVNNFYRSLNGRGIRDYLSEHNHSIRIIDFGSEQVFRGRSTYTCICFINRDANGNIHYTKSDSKNINQLKLDDFIELQYENLSNHDGWILQNQDITNILNIIENTGIKLGKCFDIRNGFATLKNDVFLFTPTSEDEQFYYFVKDKVNYSIEKDICRDAIKPNTLKTEGEIISKTEKLIFPYSINENRTISLKKEDVMMKNFPLAYNYLVNYKSVLGNRDKGTRKYDEWYAFGRNQAIGIMGLKLLFPYISNVPYFVYSNQRDLLFYNGYALISESEEDLLIAQKVLNSKLFWFYITHTSKPYGSSYYALAKNYVKNFGYYQFNAEEKERLLSLSDKNEIDNFLLYIYGVNL
ncbi:MAG: Eco57I restriction-modification methylase domain-containing protein [Paludibacter sp.]|nr:Eco57I restriction-modification methylase domain-containing protein [Paludibacter sp.]